MKGAITSIRWRSDPQMPLEVTSTTTSVGSWIVGSGTVSTRTSARPCQVTARMGRDSSRRRSTVSDKGLLPRRELHRASTPHGAACCSRGVRRGSTWCRWARVPPRDLRHRSSSYSPRRRSRLGHDVFTWLPSASPDLRTTTPSPPEARCMSQLHPDRPVDKDEAARHHVPRRRMGDARPSDTTPEEPRLTEVTDLADLAQQAEAVARAGIADVRPACAAPLGTRGRRGRSGTRGIPASARRPAAYLAAALVGATGLGLFAAGVRAADGTDVAESSSVSVAAELGLAGGAEPVPEADATARLGELAASRTARQAEQAAAAQAQAEADRLAAVAIAEAAP